MTFIGRYICCVLDFTYPTHAFDAEDFRSLKQQLAKSAASFVHFRSLLTNFEQSKPAQTCGRKPGELNRVDSIELQLVAQGAFDVKEGEILIIF